MAAGQCANGRRLENQFMPLIQAILCVCVRQTGLVTYVLPGPQADGQLLGVQNSHSALENRFICLKNATAERNRQEKWHCLLWFLLRLKPKRSLLTVAGKPLGLINARRQRCEGEHVCVCDALAQILLLQIRTLLQIIVVNCPWDDDAELTEQRHEEKRQKETIDQHYTLSDHHSCCSR